MSERGCRSLAKQEKNYWSGIGGEPPTIRLIFVSKREKLGREKDFFRGVIFAPLRGFWTLVRQVTYVQLA
jgi:hypothetical protein